MRTLAGGDIRVAIRVIDAGGLLNLSTAYRFDPTRDITQPMPMTDVAIQGLNPTGFAQLTWDLVRERIHNDATRGRVGSTGRLSTPPSNMLDYNTGYVRSPVNPFAPSNRWEPFDSSEMVSLASSTLNPDANSGRIASLLADQPALYANIRRYITPWAVTRNLSRHYSGALGQALYSQSNYVKVDLNRPLPDPNTYPALYNAFYNAIPAGVPGFTKRAQIAAQMAINVAQFRSDPTDATNPFWYTFVSTDPNTTVFGVKRQPFLSKVFCKLYRVDANAASIRAYSAIELMNPFNTPIDLAKYSISGGGLPLPKSLSGTIPAATPSGPGKFVIASHDSTKIPIYATPGLPAPCVVAGLDLSKAAKIVRTFTNPVAGGDKTGVIVCLIPTVQQPSTSPGDKKVSTVQWDDRLTYARYTIASARGPDNTATDYTSATADGGTMTAANTVIGKTPNNDIGARTEGPCPVYVRGGPFLNVGELSRILYVGPTDASVTTDGNDLMRRIDAGSPTPGRFDPTYMPDATNTTAGYPKLPVGALFADHLTVMPGTDLTAQTLGGYPEIISGQININTAPKAVLRCLPPIFALSQTDPTTAEALISAIVAYRDNTDASLRPSTISNYRTDASDPQVGFLSVGELAMPLWMKGGTPPAAPAGLGKLPQNVYRLSPEAYTPLKNYALDPNGGDDGLRIETTGPQARVDNDLPKKHLYYSWLSNHVTVRSDTFIVFIRVQVVAGTIPTTGDPYQRYVAVIDRSRMRSGGPTDRPQIVLFAQVR
jgi:hypothetical protein